MEKEMYLWKYAYEMIPKAVLERVRGVPIDTRQVSLRQSFVYGKLSLGLERQSAYIGKS